MGKLVSVIIPTYKGEKVIENCLESIKRQTYKNIEIIVVDNNSPDNTKKVSREYTKKVYNKGPERSAQRNFGAEKSKGDYLFFIDHDMILGPKVVEQCVEKMDKFGAVIIPELSFGEGYWSKCKSFERSLYNNDDTIEIPRFIKKELFKKIGGYDLELTGPEDYAFSNEIKKHNIKTSRIKELILHDEGKLTLKKLIKKRYHYGRYFRRYKEKYPKFEKQQTGFNRIKIMIKPKLLKKPHLTIGVIFMKACEFVAHKYGMVKGI